MPMQFYMTPGSCTTAIHVLLEEAGLVFEVCPVNLLNGDHLQPAYLSLNPKATIPTLVLKDGQVLTDFLTIALWLAKSHPRRLWWPTDLLEELILLEKLNYVVNVIHGAGFTRIFTTDKYCSDPAQHAAIQSQGEQQVTQGFELVAAWLAQQPYLGTEFSIADAALFYVEFWAEHRGMALPTVCREHFQRMLARPTVRQVLAEEGYGAALQRWLQ